MAVNVLLADDHKIVRDGLRILIENHGNMNVVAEAENGQKAITLAKELHPQVIIMDISMPDMNGIDATRRITSDFPGIKVIALSMHTDRHFVVGMLEAGAAGYLLKDCAFEELVSAIHTVLENHTYLSPTITDIVVRNYVHKEAKPSVSVSSELTARERELLQLLAEGMTAKQIAKTLRVSVKTVETHRRNIAQKLGAGSVAELIKYAIREGLTTLDS
ncbi:DNA-binding response regulator, NarL/FixJ family, contains REC and HTH domains [Syntrophus gentianae]|uniref:DNA-binding response regulator, NarL/FixJ family, contains REC and HTH domains n=1 Tax=Syntrophus gentianae TaxID=43775 RepID=A0A1H7WL77_9BACT|nr:response regulator transcription factor [Syntrophus gentianae]SEM22114.1 DNA-binding response regulator, NarL/FixJ family, contains REC and HTH domains [Syntrophus gentianae]